MIKLFSLSDKAYDVLKWIVFVVMPAVATLYVACASIWGLPYSEEVSATTAALVLFLGAFLNTVSAQYQIVKAKASSAITQDYPNAPYPFEMSGEVYEALKWLAQVALPAFSTVYLALAKIWTFPYPEQVSATIMAVVLFIGSVLKISSAFYQRAKQSAINSL